MYIFIPIYIKILGIEAFGVISFYSLLFGIVFFAESGLSSAITREFAKNVTNLYKKQIFLSVEKYFSIICISLSIIIFVFSGIISKKWIHSTSIDANYLSTCIKIVAIALGFQLFSSIHYGALMGLQKQVVANTYQFFWNFSKAVGILIIFFLVKTPSLFLFFFWQMLCNIVYLLLLRQKLLHEISTAQKVVFLTLHTFPKEFIIFIKSMALISLLSVINMQADKIITSNYFSLSEFAYYSVASTIGQIPFLIASPIAVTVFPLLVSSISKNSTSQIADSYVKYCFWVSSFIFPFIVAIFLFSHPIVSIFIRQGSTSKAEFVAKQLIVGGAFLALQLIPYYLLLAHGKTKYTYYQSIAQVIFMIPALIFCTKYIGFKGVAIPWIIINSLSFIYLTTLVGKLFFTDNNYGKMVVHSLIIPFITNAIIGILCYFFIQATATIFITAVYSIFIFSVTIIVNLMLFNKVRPNQKIVFSKSLIPSF